MDDRLARLEATVGQLCSTVKALEERVATLEGHQPAAAAAPAAGDPKAPGSLRAARPARNPDDPIVILSLIGRLFLVLAGGFFLRAMTEAGLLISQAGIALAFAYGFAWLYLANRASQRQQATSAGFHAAAFAMVVFPLLVEATTRFQVLPPGGAAMGLALLTAALLWVAWRRRLAAAAWIAVVAALPTSVVLLLKTGEVLPFALQPVALGVATLWLGYELGWNGMRWLAALVANLVIVGVTLRALGPQAPGVFLVALVLQWSLLAAYAAGFAIRTVVRRRAVGWFEVAQTIAVLVVIFGGAILLAGISGARAAAIGAVSLVLGSVCYALALVFFNRHEDPGHNVDFYSTLALVLVLAGAGFLLRAPTAGLLFALLAMLAAGLWARGGRLYMLLHSAVYLVAAVAASGALAYGARALATAPSGPWTQPGGVLVAVLGAGLACAGLAAARPAPEGGAVAAGLRLVLNLACAWVVAGCITGWVAPFIAGLADGTVDAGALATLRTTVLALGTLLVAWIGRHARFREWAWLVYPLLVVTGLKMVAQDFGQSRPATLFIALALYGAALILAPRLRKPRAPVSEMGALRLARASPP